MAERRESSAEVFDRPHHHRSDRIGPRFRIWLMSGFWRIFLVSSTVAFAVIAAWALATPLFSAPDEPAQVVHAAAVVRGQWVGHTIGNAQSASTEVIVPSAFIARSAATCFAFVGGRSATCAAPLRGSAKAVSATTYIGRYPPLYFAIVGLPSLVWRSPGGIWAMRITSSGVNALLLGLSVATVTWWSRRRLMLVGILLAATPAVLYLAGVVNPNGLECMSALCLWSAGMVLVFDHPVDPPRGLVAVMGTSAALLALTRGISPLWVTLILLMVALSLGWRQTVGILTRLDGAIALAAVMVATAVAVSWIVTQHALDLIPAGAQVAGQSDSQVLRGDIGNSYTWFEQMVGVLGWLDTSLPRVTYLFWFIAVGGVAALGALVARGRRLAVLVLLVLLVLTVPVAIEYSQARRVGMVWQGRYILPLAVGIPMLSTALIDESAALASLRNRLATLLTTGVLVAQVAAFAETVRRYAVGDDGTLAFWRSRWQPPAGVVVTCIWLLLAMASFVGLLRLLAGRVGATAVEVPGEPSPSSPPNETSPATAANASWGG